MLLLTDMQHWETHVRQMTLHSSMQLFVQCFSILSELAAPVLQQRPVLHKDLTHSQLAPRQGTLFPISQPATTPQQAAQPPSSQ